MVTSYFRMEVEIQLLRACAMKHTQYNPYLWPICRHFRILKEIGIEEHVSVLSACGLTDEIGVAKA